MTVRHVQALQGNVPVETEQLEAPEEMQVLDSGRRRPGQGSPEGACALGHA